MPGLEVFGRPLLLSGVRVIPSGSGILIDVRQFPDVLVDVRVGEITVDILQLSSVVIDLISKQVSVSVVNPTQILVDL